MHLFGSPKIYNNQVFHTFVQTKTTPIMKYIIRAVKYFVYTSVIVCLTLAILVVLGFVSSDVNVMFREGWKSVGLIAAMFAFVSAFYPRFGYLTRMVHTAKPVSQLKSEIGGYMEGRGYKLETSEAEVVTYVKRSIALRILRLGEDRITISSCTGGFEVEGPSREVQPIVSGLDYRLSDPNGDTANY